MLVCLCGGPLCVCVRACVRAFVRACVRACVRVRKFVRVYACACVSLVERERKKKHYSHNEGQIDKNLLQCTEEEKK